MDDPENTDTDFAQARVRFPGEEAGLPWLAMLLDAYAIVDTGVAIAIKEQQEERGVKLACRKGCEACCRAQSDIPVYPFELVGLYWFATEKISGPERDALKQNLIFHAKGSPCPFLMDGACSVHAIRPVSCRQFNVFGEPCAPGEDPFFTRRDDVLTPVKEFTVRAFSVMLPFYDVKEATDEAVNKIINGEVINLQSFDWKKLVRTMEGFDSRNP